jgi:hypothetical protein
MSPTVTTTDLDRIDSDISVASIALGIARASYRRCPSGENARAVDVAVAVVDRLLDQRLTVRA